MISRNKRQVAHDRKLHFLAVVSVLFYCVSCSHQSVSSVATAVAPSPTSASSVSPAPPDSNPAAVAMNAKAPATFLPTDVSNSPAPGAAPQGMVWIPGGVFSMGANEPPDGDAVGMHATTDARPIHRVYVDGFWMDRSVRRRISRCSSRKSRCWCCRLLTTAPSSSARQSSAVVVLRERSELAPSRWPQKQHSR